MDTLGRICVLRALLQGSGVDTAIVTLLETMTELKGRGTEG